jgi:hypothetical protein
MERDDYFKGRHFWTHFWCGLVAGVAVGGWICWNMFNSRWACAGLAAGIALAFAYCAGKWGDPFWYWIISHWQ